MKKPQVNPYTPKIMFEIVFIAVAFVIVMAICVFFNVPESFRHGLAFGILPKMSENPVAHVRPHGKDSNDKLPLPDGRMMTKQCFWLNSSYIANQIYRRL